MRRRFLCLLIVLAVGSSAYKCEAPKGNAPKPAPPPAPVVNPPAGGATQPDVKPGDPNPHKTMTIKYGSLGKKYLPGHMTSRVEGAESSTVPPEDIVTSSDVITHTVVYNPEAPVVFVEIVFTASKGGSTQAFCSIDAGDVGHDGPTYMISSVNQDYVDCYMLIKNGKRA